MAKLWCVNRGAHDTIRNKSTSSNRPALAQVHRNTAHNARQLGHGPRGAATLASSPLSRSMSRRNGNGAKLQKRSRISKSMIGAPHDFQHVSHVDKDEAMISQEMKEFVHALRQSETMPGIPNSDTIIITSAGSSSKESTEAKRLSEGQQARQSFDGPGRKPTVNKRKAPPPITPSIIKDAGLPSSLATNARQNLPLSPNSPPSPAQGLRDTPVRLKAKRQSKVPVVQEGNEPSHVQHDQLGNSTIDGLGGLNGLSPLEGFLAVHQNEVTSPNEQSAGPARSATLNNLALSESMENVVRRADDISRQDDTLPPPKLVTASTSGPLAYMTDSTKIRWDNGMAEIAKQLKEQNL